MKTNGIWAMLVIPLQPVPGVGCSEIPGRHSLPGGQSRNATLSQQLYKVATLS